MRPHLFAALPRRRRPPAEAIEFLAAPYRRAPPTPTLVDLIASGRRMAPSKQDLEALRGLVRWARTHEGDAEIRIRSLAEALDRAIKMLEERHDSVTEMLLVGIWQATMHQHGNRWLIVDPDLMDFVGRELVKRYGPSPGRPETDPPSKRSKFG